MKSLPQSEQPLRAAARDPFIPTGAEAPRLPKDYEIGPLGPESAPRDAYAFARAVAAAAAGGHDLIGFYGDGAADPSALPSAAAAEQGQAPARSASIPATSRSEAESVGRVLSEMDGSVNARLGSPLPDGEGAVSFLVRFLSPKRSVSGELRLVRGDDGTWKLDSFVLDAPTERNGDRSKDAGFPDPLSYKRFL